MSTEAAALPRPSIIPPSLKPLALLIGIAAAVAAGVVIVLWSKEPTYSLLYGNLGHLRPRKLADPDMQIAVGGCLAQKDRETIVRRAPWVDVVFGTHNVGALPVLLERARHNAAAQVEILE